MVVASKCVNGLVEFYTKGFPLVEAACLLDECMSKVGVDSPVANLVGVGQGVARNRAAKTHMIKLLRSCSQTRFDVSETLSIRKLRKRQSQELIPARKTFDLVVAVITLHTTAKLVSRGNKIHQL